MDKSNQFDEVIDDIFTEFSIQLSKQEKLKKIVDEYKDALKPFVKPYIKNGFLDNKLPDRYLAEASTIYLVFEIVNQLYQARDLGNLDIFWHKIPEAKYYIGFSLPEELSRRIRTYTAEYIDTEERNLKIAEITEESLSKLRRKSLGEFFTPREISKHLVQIMNFYPGDILENRLCDPACGSGNLLSIVLEEIISIVPVENSELFYKYLNAINKNIYGFDIQPIAILLTKINLLATILPVFTTENSQIGTGVGVLELLDFPNIKQYDPLPDSDSHWDLFAPFKWIICNPPFLKAIRKRLDYVEKYDEILSGQPNLYQLFLWWANKSIAPNGTVSFLVPLSIKSGKYLSRLREKIKEQNYILSFTEFIDRKGIFCNVNQPLLALSLSRRGDNEAPEVEICLAQNGNDLVNNEVFLVQQERAVHHINKNPIWIISNNQIDYSLFEIAFGTDKFIGCDPIVEIQNGGFVWNQNKETLQPIQSNGAIPLISSQSIGIHTFEFPPKDERVKERSFVQLSETLKMRRYDQQAIILKRTTPKKNKGRRIIGTLLPTAFLDSHPFFFAENHVNLIILRQYQPELLVGLTGWINSKLVNFLFSIMNGSSHLSKYELDLLPLPIELVKALSEINQHDFENIPDYMEAVDLAIYEFYNFTPDQICRINEIVEA